MKHIFCLTINLMFLISAIGQIHIDSSNCSSHKPTNIITKKCVSRDSVIFVQSNNLIKINKHTKNSNIFTYGFFDFDWFYNSKLNIKKYLISDNLDSIYNGINIWHINKLHQKNKYSLLYSIAIYYDYATQTSTNYYYLELKSKYSRKRRKKFFRNITNIDFCLYSSDL